ncbi:HTH-like domain-containing protein [Variovorax sp. OV700]|nr:HTH-like domain-containing protein [Variovorax sp. OV700]
MTQELSSKIVEIAHARLRFGYRRIHDMLRPHFPGVNHKRVYRLYSAANLAVRKRKKVKRPASERVPLQLATTVIEVWSMDFVSDTSSGSRRCSRPGRPSRSGARTTTRSGRTAVASECHRRSSPSCIAGALAMQLEPAQQPPRSINLATPDFLVMNGTAGGGRSAGRSQPRVQIDPSHGRPSRSMTTQQGPYNQVAPAGLAARTKYPVLMAMPTGRCGSTICRDAMLGYIGPDGLRDVGAWWPGRW